jgi:hypothetical protein
MCIVVMVTLVETSADILAVGEIIGTKVDSKRLGNGCAPTCCRACWRRSSAFTQSAFAQNVGLVAVTGVKSRYVVATGGLILVTLGLLPVMGRVIAAVPTSVLGGAGLVLFGTVAASGIRTLSKVDYRNNVNLIIVATSLGFGMIPIAAPNFYDHFPAGSPPSSTPASARRRSWPSCSTCCSTTSPRQLRPAVGVRRRQRAHPALPGHRRAQRRRLFPRRQAVRQGRQPALGEHAHDSEHAGRRSRRTEGNPADQRQQRLKRPSRVS